MPPLRTPPTPPPRHNNDDWLDTLAYAKLVAERFDTTAAMKPKKKSIWKKIAGVFTPKMPGEDTNRYAETRYK